MTSPDPVANHIEVHDVLFRNAHALDDRDWASLRTCFRDDAVCEVGATLRGIESIVAFAEGVLAGFDVTQHLIANPRCTIEADRAESVCDVQAQHVTRGARGAEHYVIGGRYCDSLVRTPEGWRIVHRRLRVTWSEGDPEPLTTRLREMRRRSTTFG
jgi:3-phenylpropionate/cinnamic acid dioxygenase small subunit